MSGTVHALRGRPWARALVAANAALAGAACGDVTTAQVPAPASCPRPLAGDSARPNIVVVLTDDQQNDSLRFMATTQALVRQGVVFDNAFVTTPLCGPSRASVLTGRYAHNHQVATNGPPYGGFALYTSNGAEAASLPVWLRSGGYCTAFFGKYMNGYGGAQTDEWGYVPPGWDDWHAVLSGNDAGSAYTDFSMNDNGTVLSLSGSGQYEAVALRERVLAFLRAVSQQPSAPFFAMIAPFAPHFPQTPAPGDAGRASGLQAPRVSSFNIQADSGVRYWSLPPLSAESLAAIDVQYRGRLESVLAVDVLIDSLVSQLTTSGLMRNTYIFFLSDNGYHLGQHRLPPGKSMAVEEDLRVPLAVTGPLAQVGAHRSQLVLNIDIAPTVLDLAAIPVPASVDGRSFVPLLGPGGASAPWRQSFLAEHWFLATRPTLDRSFALVHAARWKYVEWYQGERELYDLLADPFELHNRRRTADSTVVPTLRTTLGQLKSCAGTTCRVAEDAAVPTARP